jgi:membrane protein implicated in regulation of membrane protease activity
MPWWGWLTIGFFLMGAELLGVDAAFYLIFVGSAAIVIGLISLAGLTLPIWVQWLLFSVLAIASMVLFRQKLYARLRGNVPDYANTLIGETVSVEKDMTPDAQSRVSLRGSAWTAINSGDHTISAGAEATVVEVDGMILKIQATPVRPAQPVKQ